MLLWPLRSGPSKSKLPWNWRNFGFIVRHSWSIASHLVDLLFYCEIVFLEMSFYPSKKHHHGSVKLVPSGLPFESHCFGHYWYMHFLKANGVTLKRYSIDMNMQYYTKILFINIFLCRNGKMCISDHNWVFIFLLRVTFVFYVLNRISIFLVLQMLLGEGIVLG